MTALLKAKGSMAQLEPVVAWDPAPVYVSGYTKLREGYAAAQVWQVKAAEVLQEPQGAHVHLKALESLVSEASRIPVSLPAAKARPTSHSPAQPSCWSSPLSYCSSASLVLHCSPCPPAV